MVQAEELSRIETEPLGKMSSTKKWIQVTVYASVPAGGEYPEETNDRLVCKFKFDMDELGAFVRGGTISADVYLPEDGE